MTTSPRIKTVWEIHMIRYRDKEIPNFHQGLCFASKQLAVNTIKRWYGADFNKLHAVDTEYSWTEFRTDKDDTRSWVAILIKHDVSHTLVDLVTIAEEDAA